MKLCFALVVGAVAASASGPEKVEDFALLDHEGKTRRLYYHQNDPETKALVLFVQGNGCPLVRKALPELKALRDEFTPRGVRFWMINANVQDSRAEIAAEAREFGIDMPILVDETQLVAESLGIDRTAQCLVIDPSGWRLSYRGAISDRLSYQAEKPAATREYLRDALESLLAGNPVATPRVDGPGCRVALVDADRDRHRQISYSETIAPLLRQRCADCHSQGGIAPWAMSSYEKVRGWTEMMREVVLTGQMPPWQADPHTGRFQEDQSLSVEEARTLVHWIQAGAPRGEGPDPLAETRIEHPEWKLGAPDHVIEIGAQTVPAEGVIDYRYVNVPSPIKEDAWLRAVEVNPGNTRVLHHVLVMAYAPDDTEKRRPKSIAGYAPGTQPEQFPEGTGVLLKAGWNLDFQLHYTASGREETDASRLGLHFHPEKPAKELRSGVVLNTRFRIPPGARDYEVSHTNRFNREVMLYAMNPHMHYRGKAMRYEAHYPDGTSELLLSVPRYHFNWQRSYRLVEPKPLPKDTQLVVYATWDNSPLNLSNPDPAKRVRWGEQSWDEMFFASYQYVHAENPPPPAEPAETRP